MYIILYHPKHIYLTNNPRVLQYVCYRGSIFMLYNPISTYVTGRTTRLSTPPYTPHDSQPILKTLILTHLLPPPGRGLDRRRPKCINARMTCS